ncbi:MAG: ribose-5-phosphate isomerase RpiA [Rhodobacteraceae bacterium]|nr:MAG: ribose-5-phosphate isomerase RpiA [Paracoccaceae bacterium]
MSRPLTPADLAKQAAGRRAVDFVEPGMRVGLGTGSTAEWFVRALGEKVRAGDLARVVGVPTSIRTGKLAEAEGVKLTTLDEAGWLDLTVDGADEIDPELSLIKGGGGALLQEKIVATASDRMIVIADPSKQVQALGAFPLPIEIVPFGWETTKAIVERLLTEFEVAGRRATLRLDKDAPFLTDGGHMILDLHLGRIEKPKALAARLLAVPGVVETGLFINIADLAVIGHEDGETEIVTRAGA